MKFKLSALLLTSLATIPAFAQETAGFEISPDAVVQSIEFTGRPGKIATALLVRNEENPSLLILERDLNDVRNAAVIDNDQLNLVTDGLAGNNSSLAINKAGSLQIVQGSENGRDRFNRTLTVAYRNGKYVVAGFTYHYHDAIGEFEPENCDYNLLSGKGVNAGKAVRIKAQPLDLKTLVDDGGKLISCHQWK